MVKVTLVDPKMMQRDRRAAAKDLPAKRVLTPEGKKETVYVIDTAHPDFRDRFQTVFQLNVSRARKNRGRAHKIAAE